MRGAVLPLPHYVSMVWYLVKYKDSFTFYLYIIVALPNERNAVLFCSKLLLIVLVLMCYRAVRSVCCYEIGDGEVKVSYS
jgi:hypothetical protein